jgi:hypothetical protein
MPSVATVANGVVTGVAAGNATITVTTADGGFTATCNVTVTTAATIPVTGVTLDKPTLTLNVGASETLTATVAPTNAANKNVSWSTSNSSVAVVSGGTVTALSAGSAVITVTTVDGNKTATCAVTVTASGGGSQTFTSVSDFGTWLSDPSTIANTAATAYEVKLNVSGLLNCGSVLIGEPDKYVKLDFKDSTFTTMGSAFYNCKNLVSVTLPDGFTSIGESAFEQCTSLASVIMPDSVTIIDVQAFMNCSGLTSVTFEGNIPATGFNANAGFPGDLRSVFYATDNANGTQGTYTRASGGTTWTKS